MRQQLFYVDKKIDRETALKMAKDFFGERNIGGTFWQFQYGDLSDRAKLYWIFVGVKPQ